MSKNHLASPGPAPAIDAAALLRYWRLALLWEGLPNDEEPKTRVDGFGGLVLVDRKHLDEGALPAEALPADMGEFGTEAVVVACDRNGHNQGGKHGEKVRLIAGVPVRVVPGGALSGVAEALPVVAWERFESDENQPDEQESLGPLDEVLRRIDAYPAPAGDEWADHWATFQEFVHRLSKKKGAVAFGVLYGSGAATRAIVRAYWEFLEGRQ